MSCQTHNRAIENILEFLLKDGSSAFKEALEVMLNEAMRLERSRYLQAESYERTASRVSYANGFKPKRLKTRVGTLSLQVPQARDSRFYPSALEKGTRTERALMASLAEMYVQGVSTRKVSKIVEELCGFEVSSSEVSRATASLDETFSAWRTRGLGHCRYLYLDARYEKVRHGGSVVDCAVLLGIGIDDSGRRRILGVSVSLSEQEPHWRAFLQDLTKRGLHGVELIISDAHAGLKAAKRAVFPSVRWQRCQFHLQQNAQSYVPKKSMKHEVTSKIRAIFNAPNDQEAKRLLNMAVEEYRSSAPHLSEWMSTNIEEGLTVFQFPESFRKKLRTTNMLERFNREIKRRTRVASIFPNIESCLRLVTALAMEQSEEWETGKIYMSPCETES